MVVVFRAEMAVSFRFFGVGSNAEIFGQLQIAHVLFEDFENSPG